MRILGFCMIATPFIVLSIYMIKESGWKITFQVWGFVLAVVAFLMVGARLAVGGR